MNGHMEYWLSRGEETRRRIASLGRRFGSKGGIGAWETFRLIQAAYLLVVWYGPEFIADDKKLLDRIQIRVNDIIRSVYRTPIKVANSCLLAEASVPPVYIKGRYLQRRCWRRCVSMEHGIEYPWFNVIGSTWEEHRIVRSTMDSDKERTTKCTVTVKGSKDSASMYHEMLVE